jgi:cytochrome c553
MSTLLALCSELCAKRSKLLAPCSVTLVLILIFFCILYPDRASSGPYLDSAHGNTSYGVLRTSLATVPNNYSRGNCAHCHEQHTSIGGIEPAPNSPAGPDFYLLFKDLWESPIQSNVFCFGCHTGIGSLQSDWQRTNYSYSYWGGGDTSLTCPSSIYESFQFVQNDGTSQPNCGSSVGSSHLIQNIVGFIAGKAGFPSNYDYINPCSACHNPHRAQRDPHSGTRIDPDTGKLVSAVSRPSQHTNLETWELYGDDDTERMNSSTQNYWAPRRIGGGYEPDGSLTQDGSNMVDNVRLCIDCHNSTNVIYSSRLGKNLYRINWTMNGDFHGNRARIDNGGPPYDFTGPDLEWGDLLEPYKDRVSGTYPKLNYVLSCLDCHEPHGSPNEFLLRPTLNATPVSNITTSGRWFYWCQACHRINLIGGQAHTGPLNENFDCFNNGSCHRHCNGTDCSSNNLF